MNLFASIKQRKSCRDYDMQPLGQAFIAQIESAIKAFEPLYPDFPLNYRFTGQVKGRYHVRAPHYLVIGGQRKPGEMENAGFVFEQLALWLDAMEIGCVWLGASKDTGAGYSDQDMIILAFGRVNGEVHRSVDQFKRKPIETITNAPDNPCVQAAHLAPSGMNTQPWYFEKQGDRVLVYEKKLALPLSLLYKHSDIDMGIALCHYALACKEIGKPFRFLRDANLADKPGYLPFGTIG